MAAVPNAPGGTISCALPRHELVAVRAAAKRDAVVLRRQSDDTTQRASVRAMALMEARYLDDAVRHITECLARGG